MTPTKALTSACSLLYLPIVLASLSACGDAEQLELPDSEVAPTALSRSIEASVPGAEASSNEDLLALAESERAELGLTEVLDEDGNYVYQLPPTIVTPPYRVEGGVTWHYDGQQRFTGVAPEADADPVLVGPDLDPLPADPVQQMLGSVQVDDYGRRWIATHANSEALAAAEVAYDAEVAQTFGVELDEGDFGYDEEEAVDADSAGAEFYPMSYPLTRTYCKFNGKYYKEHRFFGSDDRQQVRTPYHANVETSVLLMRVYRDGSIGRCTATMVDDEWALTAAHCITNRRGRIINPRSTYVCTHGNLEMHRSVGDLASCYRVNRLVKPGYYRGASDVADDFAVVRLRRRPPRVGWMPISKASDATLLARTAHKVAYPARRPRSCDSNFEARQHRELYAARLYVGWGTIHRVGRRRIMSTLATSPGESGGPFYYFPRGGRRPFLTGVTTGILLYPGNHHISAVKGSRIRRWVINATPRS
ncbi:MAG: trypsin-like serine protease [Myxococcota bacterium]